MSRFVISVLNSGETTEGCDLDHPKSRLIAEALTNLSHGFSRIDTDPCQQPVGIGVHPWRNEFIGRSNLVQATSPRYNGDEPFGAPEPSRSRSHMVAVHFGPGDRRRYVRVALHNVQTDGGGDRDVMVLRRERCPPEVDHLG